MEERATCPFYSLHHSPCTLKQLLFPLLPRLQDTARVNNLSLHTGLVPYTITNSPTPPSLPLQPCSPHLLLHPEAPLHLQLSLQVQPQFHLHVQLLLTGGVQVLDALTAAHTGTHTCTDTGKRRSHGKVAVLGLQVRSVWGGEGRGGLTSVLHKLSQPLQLTNMHG